MHQQREKRADVVKHLAGEYFLDADKDGSKALSYAETERLLKELHVSVNKKYLQQLFKTYDVNNNGLIDLSEFIIIIRDISKKEELQPVFQKYCQNYNKNANDQTPMMTPQEYQRFCFEEQKIVLSLNEAIEIFKTTLSQGVVVARPKDSNNEESIKISFYQFSNFIFNQDNSIFDPHKMELYQDMDRPLSDYFINSSHNTYLLANQLTGDSSCQAYINALLNGCRCVEIDCWDGDKGEPIVYHGHTLTSRILFKDVLDTINQYAFVASPFPVILSFENHCSLEQSKKMAAYTRSIFQEKLYLIPKDYNKFEYQKSPNQLRGKILVKSKGSVEKAVNQNSVVGYLSDSEDEEDDEAESETDLKVLKNNTIPDFSMIERPKDPNGTIGKKKEAFNKMNKNEQQQVLLTMSQKQQMVQDRPIQSQSAPSQFSKNSSPYPQHESKKSIAQDSNPSKVDFDRSQNTISNPLITQKGFENNYAEIEDNIPKRIQTLANLAAQEVADAGAAVGSQSLSNLQGSQSAQQKGKKAGSHKKEKQLECKEMIEITTMFGCHINMSDLNRMCWYISSLSEVKYNSLLRKYPLQLIQIFKKSFVRLYPSGMRVDSSNYDPIKCFLSGVQIVALNFQTRDVPMLLNQAKFRENGGFNSGYVLKPDYMLHDTKKTYAPVLMTKVIKTVRIQVISGQQLRPENYENDTFDVVDPYIQVFVRGTDHDESINKPQVTQVISDNGFHPIWNSPVYEFNFSCPELAMVVFRVMDSDVGTDTQLGMFATPVDTLRHGYRVVPLRQKSTHELIDHCFILVKIEVIEKITRPCMTIHKS